MITRRHRARAARRGSPGLNLVSLMDIFTILVFFLLVNSSSAEQAPGAGDLELPLSTARTKPEDSLVIAVDGRRILVQGREVARLGPDKGEERVIPALEAALQRHAERGLGLDGDDGPRRVTVLGDRAVPYRVLRRVIATCARTPYRRVALAVNQTVRAGGEG